MVANNERARLQLFPIAKTLADCVIGAEYGIYPDYKMRIASKIARELIGKLAVDLRNVLQESLASAPPVAEDAMDYDTVLHGGPEEMEASLVRIPFPLIYLCLGYLCLATYQSWRLSEQSASAGSAQHGGQPHSGTVDQPISVLILQQHSVLRAGVILKYPQWCGMTYPSVQWDHANITN